MPAQEAIVMSEISRPLPCSALYCCSQRRIAVWPMPMHSLTFWTLWPCSLISRTTSGFRLAYKLDFVHLK